MNIRSQGGKPTKKALTQGYIHKVCVTVEDIEVYFDRDKEGIFKVVRMPGE